MSDISQYTPARAFSDHITIAAGPAGATFTSARPLGSPQVQLRRRFDDGVAVVADGKCHGSRRGEVDHRHQFNRWRPADSREEGAGFDEGDLRTMASQLVPVGCHRHVRLRWHQHASVYSESPSIADLEPAKGPEIRIYGKSPGTTYLHAVNQRGTCWSALQVVVRRFFAIPLVFHRLTDGSGRHSTRPASEIPGLLERVNRIFERQTCLMLQDSSPGALNQIQVKRDLSDEVTVDSNLYQQVRHSVNEPTVVHVIFVWKIHSRSAFDDRIGGETFGDLVFLTDGLPDAGKSLAHEIGHVLTKNHEEKLGYVDSHRAGSGLMDPLASSTRISRREAECMYEDVTRRLVRGTYLKHPPASACSHS